MYRKKFVPSLETLDSRIVLNNRTLYWAPAQDVPGSDQWNNGPSWRINSMTGTALTGNDRPDPKDDVYITEDAHHPLQMTESVSVAKLVISGSTLELNGYSFTVERPSNADASTSVTTLNLSGNGKISLNGANSKFYLNKVTIATWYGSGNSGFYYGTNGYGTVTIKNGTNVLIDGGGTKKAMANFVVDDSMVVVADTFSGNIQLEGGDFDLKNQSLLHIEGATTITGSVTNINTMKVEGNSTLSIANTVSTFMPIILETGGQLLVSLNSLQIGGGNTNYYSITNNSGKVYQRVNTTIQVPNGYYQNIDGYYQVLSTQGANQSIWTGGTAAVDGTMTINGGSVYIADTAVTDSPAFTLNVSGDFSLSEASHLYMWASPTASPTYTSKILANNIALNGTLHIEVLGTWANEDLWVLGVANNDMTGWFGNVYMGWTGTAELGDYELFDDVYNTDHHLTLKLGTVGGEDDEDGEGGGGPVGGGGVG